MPWSPSVACRRRHHKCLSSCSAGRQNTWLSASNTDGALAGLSRYTISFSLLEGLPFFTNRQTYRFVTSIRVVLSGFRLRVFEGSERPVLAPRSTSWTFRNNSFTSFRVRVFEGSERVVSAPRSTSWTFHNTPFTTRYPSVSRPTLSPGVR